jgi:hypothetical protein
MASINWHLKMDSYRARMDVDSIKTCTYTDFEVLHNHIMWIKNGSQISGG